MMNSVSYQILPPDDCTLTTEFIIPHSAFI